MAANIFSDIPDNLPEELIDILVQKKKLRIERIVSRGHVSTEWYDQDTNEFVLVVKGEAKLRFEKGNGGVHLKTGDYLIIPAHQRHIVEWTIPEEDTVWLAIHY